MNIVLDSSVIAKLFIDEKDSDDAAELFEKSIMRNIELIASNLIFYEVGNAILKHLRATDEDGSEYLNNLFFLHIIYDPLDRILACEAMKIAKSHNITYYDAVHIALSQRHTTALVTEDKELQKKFENAVSIKDALERIEEESTS